MIQVIVAAVAESLVPEESIGADGEAVDGVFVLEVVVRPESMQSCCRRGAAWGLRGKRISRVGIGKEKGLSVAQVAVEDTVKDDVLGRAEIVVDSESEDTSRRMLAQGAAVATVGGEKLADGRGGDDAGRDVGRVEAEDRNVTLGVRSWNAKDAVAFGDVTIAVSGD